MELKKLQTTKHRKLSILQLSLAVILILQIGLVVAGPPEFKEVLKPLETIYSLVKYAATVIAGLVMLFAGITYISSGSDPGKRDKAKSMVTYVFVGLIVIWAAPFVVDLILDN
jgi:cation transport ATPase